MENKIQLATFRVKRPGMTRSFGPKIRHLRKRKGWSLSKLAVELEYSGNSRGYISELERVVKPPVVETVIRAAVLFGVTIDYLLRDDIPIEDVQEYKANRP